MSGPEQEEGVANAAPDHEAQPEPASRKRSAGVVAIGVLAAVALLTVLAVLGARASARTVVPGVTGLDVATARSEILRSRLSTGAEFPVPGTRLPDGVVVTQRPAAGTPAVVGSPVDLSLTVPPTPTNVPDLGLADSVLAEQALTAAFLRPIMYSQLSSSVPEGRIVSQLPAPGSPVMTGSAVALFVSAGVGSGGVPVPDVVGMKYADASSVLAQVHLIPTWPTLPFGTEPSGKVAQQQPAPGSRVPVGSGVPLLLVSN